MTTPTPEAIEAAVDTFNRHNGGFRESFVAALAAYESAMEAAGWVKVPTEITYLMAFAGDRAMDDHPRGWRVIWSAMIAARPGMLERDRPSAASVPRQVARIVAAMATMTESFNALVQRSLVKNPFSPKYHLVEKPGIG